MLHGMERKKYTWKIDPATLHEARSEQTRRGQADRWAQAEAHNAASDVMRRRWQDPEYQAHMKEVREATSEKRIAAAKARWDKPGAREHHGEQMAAAWTPERRAEQATRVRERLANPEARAKATEAMRQVWQDPAQQERRRSAMSDRWADPEYRAARVAEARTPERRAIASAAAKAKWNRMTPEQQQAEMQRLHGTIGSGNAINKLEARVAQALNAIELPYLLHKAIGDYVVDFYLPATRTVIEADGKYWHRDRTDSDATRDAWFSANGYRVIRVPEDADEAVIRGLIEEIG